MRKANWSNLTEIYLSMENINEELNKINEGDSILLFESTFVSYFSLEREKANNVQCNNMSWIVKMKVKKIGQLCKVEIIDRL